MAFGEPPGKTVGYRTRLDTKVSQATRIEVVTEGILTRLIQADPELTDYAAVLFDEFHERSLQADLGLALVRESQQALREDLRVVVMSATLDTDPLARLLDNAPVISAEGRQYPVEIEYRPAHRDKRPDDHVAATVREVLDNDGGSLLVFLPGVGEIRRVFERLEGRVPGDVVLAPLYGNLSGADQDAAIAPAPEGTRKVVLATAIAESSLTIEGIRVVIDAGLQRRPVFDPGGGMSRLITQRVSRSSADQRAGRAGRREAGRCIRLWPESERLEPFTPAEITGADGLDLAARVEGNLLAAAQEIDKLLLLGETGTVDVDRVAEAVSDSARWSVFDLTDAMLAGDAARTARIANGLRGEGTQPPVLVWALHRELHQLASIAGHLESGQAVAAAMKAAGVWPRRQSIVRGAVGRFDASGWRSLGAGCARLERVAKGAARGSFWDELLELTLTAAGSDLPRLAPRRSVTVEY